MGVFGRGGGDGDVDGDASAVGWWWGEVCCFPGAPVPGGGFGIVVFLEGGEFCPPVGTVGEDAVAGGDAAEAGGQGQGVDVHSSTLCGNGVGGGGCVKQEGELVACGLAGGVVVSQGAEGCAFDTGDHGVGGEWEA